VISSVRPITIVDWNLDAVGHFQRTQHPLRQFDTDLARTEHRTIGLLQDQAQAPGGEQRIERTLVEMTDQRPFDQHPQRAGRQKRKPHREEEVSGEQ
jgi:hypothetical protein